MLPLRCVVDATRQADLSTKLVLRADSGYPALAIDIVKEFLFRLISTIADPLSESLFVRLAATQIRDAYDYRLVPTGYAPPGECSPSQILKSANEKHESDKQAQRVEELPLMRYGRGFGDVSHSSFVILASFVSTNSARRPKITGTGRTSQKVPPRTSRHDGDKAPKHSDRLGLYLCL